MYNEFQAELICCSLAPHKTQDACAQPQWYLNGNTIEHLLLPKREMNTLLVQSQENKQSPVEFLDTGMQLTTTSKCSFSLVPTNTPGNS